MSSTTLLDGVEDAKPYLVTDPPHESERIARTQRTAASTGTTVLYLAIEASEPPSNPRFELHTVDPGTTRTKSDPQDVERSDARTYSDLGAFGCAIHEQLSELEDAEGDGDEGCDAVLVLDSVTGLLDATETERVFRFLHLLIERADRAGVGGVYFFDSEAHDARVRGTIGALFGANGSESTNGPD